MKKVFCGLLITIFSVFSLLFFGLRTDDNSKHSSCSACFSGKYSSGGAEYSAEDINSINIKWIGGRVTISESDGKVLSFSEESYGKKLGEDQKLHWRIEKGESSKGKLIIEAEDPSVSNKWSRLKKSLPEKNLTVYVPKNLDNLSLIVVNSVCDIKESTTKAFYLSGVGGTLDVSSLKCDKIDVDGVNLNLNVKLNDNAGYSVYRDGVFDGFVGEDEQIFGDGKIKINLKGVNCKLKTL